MTAGNALAEAALALVGRPFRLHGRDPATGLDCIGLVAVALQRTGHPALAPAGYRLRNPDIDAWLQFAGAAGLRPAHGPARPGDVLLVAPGPWQHHLLVAGQRGHFIHAHAGLGRVVEMPGPLPWPTVRHWRIDRKG
jgi:cell wall-associated NlpC family hydrolase